MKSIALAGLGGFIAIAVLAQNLGSVDLTTNAYAFIVLNMSIQQPEICLAHSLRRADRVISQIYNEYLAPLGVRVTQFSVLRTLHYLDSTTATQIQETLIMEQATVSRALKPLIRDGYVNVAEGTNKREKLLSLSPAGQELYHQALVPWQQAQTEIREKLGSDIDNTLNELSQQIVALKR